MSTHAKAVFEIKSWDEKPWLEMEGSAKLTRASVGKVYTGDIDGEAKSESLMCYRADGTAVFTGYERIEGTIAGRKGSLVLEAAGEYRDGAATCECTVVPGSGVGGLAGIAGTGRYVATHSDYPRVSFSLEYTV